MSILIKGMEMPKACVVCPCAREVDGSCHITGYKPTFFEWYEDGVKGCPLVEIPPHGRLIDADATIEDIRGEILEHQMNGMKGTPFYIEDLRTMWQRLEDEDTVPTIIEADESDMDSFIRIFEEDDEEDGMDSFIQILKD